MDIHLCINGDIWTGYNLDDAVRNFMDDCGLYDKKQVSKTVKNR